MFRDEAGRYLKDEWISISDIGQSFDGVILTDEEYIAIEDKYIEAVKLIIQFHSLTHLSVNKFYRWSLEEELHSRERFLSLSKSYSHLYSNKLIDFYLNFNEGQAGIDEVGSLCRLQLRENMGVDIFYPRKLKLFIGYDYLMGIHSSKSLEPIIPQITAMGLFVER